MKLEEIVPAVVDALNAAEIPYLLTGSFSSNYYGIPRSTQDTDFVVELGQKSLQALRPHLRSEFRLDPQTAFEIVTGTVKNVIRVAGTCFQVELFQLSQDAHDLERFRRRRVVQLREHRIYLPTPEDVIITKLRWFRRKDFDDVQNVFAVQGDALDWAYIFRWCAEHNTRNQLDEILASLPLADDPDRAS